MAANDRPIEFRERARGLEDRPGHVELADVVEQGGDVDQAPPRCGSAGGGGELVCVPGDRRRVAGRGRVAAGEVAQDRVEAPAAGAQLARVERPSDDGRRGRAPAIAAPRATRWTRRYSSEGRTHPAGTFGGWRGRMQAFGGFAQVFAARRASIAHRTAQLFKR